jgi:hypothetical protein
METDELAIDLLPLVEDSATPPPPVVNLENSNWQLSPEDNGEPPQLPPALGPMKTSPIRNMISKLCVNVRTIRLR